MRRSINAIVARLRDRKRLYAELGLDRIDREMSDACTAMCEAKDAIGELEQSPNVVAAQLLASLGNDWLGFRSGIQPFADFWQRVP